MKYNLLLKTLRVLMYAKRFAWVLGRGLFFVLGGFSKPFLHFFAFVHYKTGYTLKKHGLIRPDNWVLQRGNLQIFVFLALFLVAVPQTILFKKQDSFAVGRNTIAYNLVVTTEVYELEEVIAEPPLNEQTAPSWKQGVVSTDIYAVPHLAGNYTVQNLTSVAPGGLAITKPIIMPGATINTVRNKAVDYIVESGDSLSSIAYQFDISVATVLWANNLSERSTIRPGNVLKIPPVSGLMYKVKKGDSLKKIATTFKANVIDIVSFNHLDEDGTDLKAGEEIMVPGGKPVSVVVVSPTRPVNINQSGGFVAVPAGSRQSPGSAGFVWPAGVRIVTQYFTWKHNALDIAGPMATPIYAAKSGTVTISQCGWNGGYGCYIVVDHGDGFSTRYGHNSRLLVVPGEYVETGQTIALMGNTGNVRGVTGIHSHFEVRVNGRAVNPLGYVR